MSGNIINSGGGGVAIGDNSVATGANSSYGRSDLVALDHACLKAVLQELASLKADIAVQDGATRDLVLSSIRDLENELISNGGTAPRKWWTDLLELAGGAASATANVVAACANIAALVR